jgi:arylsulfatase
LCVGRNNGSPVAQAYQAPFPFTGGAIARVKIDVSGAPYTDLERDFARAFARD